MIIVNISVMYLNDRAIWDLLTCVSWGPTVNLLTTSTMKSFIMPQLRLLAHLMLPELSTTNTKSIWHPVAEMDSIQCMDVNDVRC